MMTFSKIFVIVLMLSQFLARRVSISLDVIVFNQTIYNSKTLLIKQEFVGPRFKILDNGVKLTFQCIDMFTMELSTSEHQAWKNKGVGALVWPPPKVVPHALSSSYTINGKIPIAQWFYKEKQNGGSGYNWTKLFIDEIGNKKCTCGAYRRSHCQEAFDKYGEDFITNKRGAVIGSQSPWAEAALLALKAKHVTTVEYMQIHTDHPHLATRHPDKVGKAFLDGKFRALDFVFSFSSLEHDGMGRYGDPLNPFGDLESVARVHCLLKPGGIFFLGLPVNHDTLVWNAHRIYGKIRLALVLMNWEVLDILYDSQDEAPRLADKTTIKKCENQPIFVLKKMELPVM